MIYTLCHWECPAQRFLSKKNLTFKSQNDFKLATNKWVSQLIEWSNKRLHGAYILTGFAVQRKQIEGLAVFSKIAVECFSMFT